MRWYVFERIIPAPVAAKSAVEIDFMAPFVAQKIKFGVSMEPCGVDNIPLRARQWSDVCVILNEKFSAAIGGTLEANGEISSKNFRCRCALKFPRDTSFTISGKFAQNFQR
jgi:hypothetical protein